LDLALFGEVIGQTEEEKQRKENTGDFRRGKKTSVTRFDGRHRGTCAR
jgi:hypothetical protein